MDPSQNSGPIPKCPEHDLPARLWLTRKEPVRQFYRCPKPIGAQCNFFAWVDPQDYPIPQGIYLPPTPDSATRNAHGGQPERPTTPTPLPRMPIDNEGDPFQNRGAGPAWPPNSPPRREVHQNGGESSSQARDRETRQRSETLAQDNIPEYVRKLERKKIAAERSRDAKNTKINYLQEKVEMLEGEVERLKAREKELEEVIAAYELDA